ncbi:2',5'-phosphodiesterase 12-like isoform X2 [Bacillus rossius redtenbacheri]
MVIKAYFDSRNNELFDMCFFIHKVVRCSKVVFIEDSPMSLKLSTVFEKLSKEFRSVNVMKKGEIVRLSICGNYILGEHDCKSTIFNPANLNFDSFLEIGKYKCKIMINMPNIYFSFPKRVAFDYPVTPDFNEIDKYFDVSACDYKWFKCSDPRTSQTANWIEVGTSFSYIPKYDDLGHFLKFECTPRTSRGKAKSMVAVANNPVFHGEPKPERLHAVHRYTFTKNNLMGCSFRVVSYNVLSDIYAKRNEERGKITHCPYYAIDSTYRMELVQKEVAGYNADVICLQEVDQYAYYNMLRTFFEARGYFGVYCLKHPGLNEGLAVFFQTVKFRLCESTYVLYPKEMFCKNPVYRYLSEEVSRNKNYAAAFKRSQNSLV